jgi:hypothetical protein
MRFEASPVGVTSVAGTSPARRGIRSLAPRRAAPRCLSGGHHLGIHPTRLFHSDKRFVPHTCPDARHTIGGYYPSVTVSELLFLFVLAGRHTAQDGRCPTPQRSVLFRCSLSLAASLCWSNEMDELPPNWNPSPCGPGPQLRSGLLR